MTINDNPLGELADLVPSAPSESWSLDDVGRRSLEAFVEAKEGTSRVLDSRGLLRLTGDGISGHAILLEDLGLVTRSWQRAVSATAAALSDIKSLRGKLPTDIVTKSQLMLDASPTSGSVVLNLVPKAEPLHEVEPEGTPSILDDVRPLADHAMQRLLTALSVITESSDAAVAENIEEQLKALGPRTSSALSSFASVVERSSITVEASWQEPAQKTIRSELRPASAKFLQRVIEGRKLDEEPMTINAVIRTVSDTDSWRVDIIGEDENILMSASDLSADEVRKVRVNSTVQLRVYLSTKVMPTGETRSKYRIAKVLEIIEE